MPQKNVLNPRKISEWTETEGVAAAIESGSGKIYTDVWWTVSARSESALRETRFSI